MRPDLREAETDQELLEQALAHARDEHGEAEADLERWRPLVPGTACLGVGPEHVGPADGRLAAER